MFPLRSSLTWIYLQTFRLGHSRHHTEGRKGQFLPHTGTKHAPQVVGYVFSAYHPSATLTVALRHIVRPLIMGTI